MPIQSPPSIVRSVLASDLAGLERLSARSGGDRPAGPSTELIERATGPRGATMSRVLDRDGVLIGFLLGELLPGGADPIARIEAFVVEPDAAADGGCRRLIEEALQQARLAGATRVLALFGYQDEAVVEVFEALGFALSDVKVIERPL